MNQTTLPSKTSDNSVPQSHAVAPEENKTSVTFVSIFKDVVCGQAPDLYKLYSLQQSCLFDIIKLFFEFGLYDLILWTSNSIKLDDKTNKFLIDVFTDRSIMCLAYVRHDITPENPLHVLLAENQFSPTLANDSKSDTDLFEELKSINFNDNLSLFCSLYHYCFSKHEFRTDPFFKARIPAPIVLKNHLHYQYEAAKINNDFSEYQQACITMNSPIADDLFYHYVENADVAFFNTLSVASLHKLVRLFGLDFVINKLRKATFRENDLVIQLFKSAAELRRSHQRTGYLSSAKNVLINSDNTALCLSGQLRGAAECMPFWLNNFTASDYNSFLVTWEDVGYPTGAEAGRLLRMLPPSLSMFFPNLSVEEFRLSYPSAFETMQPRHNSRDEVSKILSASNVTKNDVSIRFCDEEKLEQQVFVSRGEVDRTHMNQIKMFYNMHCANLLLEDYEKKENRIFDWVIWTRPDFKVIKMQLGALDLNNYVYTSRISNEGRMLDYCIVMRRDTFSVLSECYFNLMSPEPSPVFGYNHGPRLITDVFLSRGFTAKEIPGTNIEVNGLKAWTPDTKTVYKAINEDIQMMERTGKKESINHELKAHVDSKMSKNFDS